MAVVENAAVHSLAPSNRDVEQNCMAEDRHHHNRQKTSKPADKDFHLMQQKIANGYDPAQQHPNGNGGPTEEKLVGDIGRGEGFKTEMRDLEEMLSKLNPMAEEFVPPSLAALGGGGKHGVFIGPAQAAAIAAEAGHFRYSANGFLGHQNVSSGIPDKNSFRKKKNSYCNAKRRINSRPGMAQRDDIIRRTVYVSDIDHQVTEEQLAALFVGCGQVVDCRVCGDPNSVLRFAFVEFTDEEGARNALSLAGYYPVRIMPSKTAIAPVNPTFLPRSEDDREMCVRTIYCTNIDKKITQVDIKLFFEYVCGEVHRLRLLGDYHHSTRIAFVEFVMAESAIAALNCSGAILGSLPIRVSPSKTPVRARGSSQSMH